MVEASPPGFSAGEDQILRDSIFVAGFEACRLSWLQTRRRVSVARIVHTDSGDLELRKNVPADLHGIVTCLDLQRNHVRHNERTVRSGVMPLGCVTVEDPGDAVDVVARDSGDTLIFMVPRLLVEEVGMEMDFPCRSDAIAFSLPPAVCDHRLLALARRAGAELAEPDRLTRFHMEVMAQELIIDMLRGHSNLAEAVAARESRARARGGLAAAQLRRALEALDAMPEGDVTLNGLAAAAGCSPTHFSRAFKQSTGFSPFAWLRRRQIDRAKHLLERSDDTIAEIALRIGFAAQPQFQTAFRRATGTTPAAWRRTNQL